MHSEDPVTWNTYDEPPKGIQITADFLKQLGLKARLLKPTAQQRALKNAVGTYSSGHMFVFVRSVCNKGLLRSFRFSSVLSHFH